MEDGDHRIQKSKAMEKKRAEHWKRLGMEVKREMQWKSKKQSNGNEQAE